MEKETVYIGIDLGGSKVRVGLVDDGKIVLAFEGKTADLVTREEVLGLTCGLIDKIWQDGLGGIGIGVPSIVDAKRGIVYDTVDIPFWNELHLKDILETRYQLPVWVNNDANCFALGEKHYGAGIDCNNLVGITIGTGLGIGIVLNGKILNGAHCGAGEIGNIDYNGARMEYFASGQYFKHAHQRPGETFLKLAIAGDPWALNVFYQYGLHLGQALLVIVYAYDPEMIVIGGSVSKSYAFFEKGMWDSINECVYPHLVKDLRIVTSNKKNIALLGASLLCRDTTIKHFKFPFNEKSSVESDH